MPADNSLKGFIISHLVSNGKSAKFYDNAARANVWMRDDSDGTGVYIEYWNVAANGAWPSIGPPGFTASHLRLKP